MENLIEKRKEKLFSFMKKKQFWVLIVLIIAIILGIHLRSLPMQIHSETGKPGLWDITTNDWTLGPDLDPWLFTRYAKTIVEQGSLPKIDLMRNVPLGFDTSKETMLLPYMIVYTHKIINIFGNYPINFSASLFPVIMFALTIISFFLFVREVFIGKGEKSKRLKANIISLISTFFMIVIPVFLSRTIAGIPEKESAAFFFMFLAFYLFLKAWKSEKLKNAIIYSSLAGIITGAMGLIWGGVIYVFGTISFSALFAFIIGKVRKKEMISYSFWAILTISTLVLISNKYSLLNFITASNGVFFVIFILLIHFILWKTKVSKRLEKIKLPKSITTLIISIVLSLVLLSLFFGPGFIVEKGKGIIGMFTNPTTGRWGVTVAENRQPYFTEWSSSFGPFIKGIPIVFWLFFIGSILLFKKTFKSLRKKDSWILTGLYVLFFFGLVFSRYSPSSILNGENFISSLFYFGSALLLFLSIFYYYIKDYKRKENRFSEIKYEFLFLFLFLILTLISARSAVRLIMVLGPVSSIFIAYLIISIFDKFKKNKDETMKIFLGVFLILVLILSLFAFVNFYKNTKYQSYSMIPSYYNQQWQKAMSWVRQETPKDSVFAHWWDYGYWVQSIGDRATVLDGGNAIVYWNYLMGRYVLTGDNQKDALEFLYNHNTTYLLIDSSDIGKYGAFSSIGSNENYDRYSWIGSFQMMPQQTSETKEQTIYFYSGGIYLDEDLVIKKNGKEILLPAQNTIVGGLIIPVQNIQENSFDFLQPSVVMIYQGQQYQLPIRYLYVNENFIDFEQGIESCVYLIPKIEAGNQISVNPIGVAMFFSPRLMKSMLVQKYILNDPFNNFPNFKLVHKEQSFIVDYLNQQGYNVPDFVYYGDLQGPIKIWEVEYTGEEKIKQEYLDKDASKYLDWRF